MVGGDWGMGRGKKTYGTYGEGGTGNGESLWNVNKGYRKFKKLRKERKSY